MLEVLYSTGIRRIELARLELRDVHRKRQTLYVLGHGELFFGSISVTPCASSEFMENEDILGNR